MALPVLTSVLADGERQEPIVRHEAAEALAAIGGEEALRWVKKYRYQYQYQHQYYYMKWVKEYQETILTFDIQGG